MVAELIADKRLRTEEGSSQIVHQSALLSFRLHQRDALFVVHNL
jgi:hypothetical protein